MPTNKTYNALYIVSIPSERGNLAQKDYELLNNRILDGLASALNKGHVSKLDRIFLDQILSPKMKRFCETVFNEIDKNCKNEKVRRNLANLGRFLIDRAGIALVTKLNEEDKILNWPNIIHTLSDPAYDFSDSDMIEYLSITAKNLEAVYGKGRNF